MLRTIGLMSGTSLDGVDAAWVETDGERIGRLGPRLTLPYDPALRRDLRALLDAAPRLRGDEPRLADCARRLTERHAEAVAALGEPAELIGFHGQTILHRPRGRAEGSRTEGGAAGFGAAGFGGAGFGGAGFGGAGFGGAGAGAAEGAAAGAPPQAAWRTWQIGDAALLARLTGTPVAFDFRSADVAAGGQGAPLVPVVHAAMAASLPKPLAVLNLGGVGNVTWIGEGGELLAFDTGPANGPIDDWVQRRAGLPFDRDGALAASGQPDGAVLARLLGHPYLAAPPPKSLDRLDFHRALDAAGIEELSAADGAATLVAFAAVAVAAAARHFPAPPRQWLVAGGGRRNAALMRALAGALAEPVRPAEVAGWDGDALEAQAFGVLAARVARGLPLTFPGTTGVDRPLTGGRIQPVP